MSDAKKGGGLGLLLIGKPKADKPKNEAKTLAAQGLIDAIEKGDAEAVSEAFSTLLDACKPQSAEYRRTSDDEDAVAE